MIINLNHFFQEPLSIFPFTVCFPPVTINLSFPEEGTFQTQIVLWKPFREGNIRKTL